MKELTLQIERYHQQKVRKDEGGRGGREGGRGGKEKRKGGRGGREGEGGDGQTDNRVNVFSSCVNMCIMTI